MNKVAILRNEIDFINDELLQEFIEFCVEEAPDYFFEMPASTTGKFHPAYTLGEGGLIKHTKAAVKIAKERADNGGGSSDFGKRGTKF